MLNWPWWVLLLILGVEGWPVTGSIALALLLVAVFARRWVRWLALAAAIPCLFLTAVAAWWAITAGQRDREAAAFEASRYQALDTDQLVDGLPLPAGTILEWRDGEHRELASASPPNPVALLGLRVSWLRSADNGEGWDLQLPEPQAIEGWTCDTTGVRVSRTGRLRSCRLAAGRDWQGWPIPAGSLLDLTTAETVGLVLPAGASMSASEIGRSITDTGLFTINADGSLDRFYAGIDDPLLVAGNRLWNTVQWTYDPATSGQGRHRRAITARGTLVSPDGDSGENVVIRLADGHVTPVD